MISWSSRPVDQFSLVVNRSSSSSSISGSVSSMQMAEPGTVRSGRLSGHVFERARKELPDEYSSESSYSFMLLVCVSV